MFQTEINVFLQSFETDLLTKIFFLITSLGFKEFFLAFVIIFMFGIDFKKGLVLTHVLIVTGLITELLKHFFSLPRPYHVDSNVKTLFDSSPNDSPFTSEGANSLFGLPSQNVIEYYRAKSNTLFGLPSGHTSTALTIWGSLIIFYKQFWVKIVSFVLILLIPLSRIYLGRHFLGDVLGGYFVGGILLYAFYLLYYKKRFRRFSSRSIKKSPKFFIHLIYFLFGPLLFFILFPEIHARLAGVLLGINFLLIYFTAKGFPIHYQKILKRILSSIIAITFFACLSFIIYMLLDFIIAETPFIKFVSSGLITAFGLWTTGKVCAGLKLIQIDHYSD